jgi:hypothetical protein
MPSEAALRSGGIRSATVSRAERGQSQQHPWGEQRPGGGGNALGGEWLAAAVLRTEPRSERAGARCPSDDRRLAQTVPEPPETDDPNLIWLQQVLSFEDSSATPSG